MPKDPIVWITLFGLAALVVILALWLGRGVVARWKHFVLKVKEPRPKPTGSISVAEDAKIQDAELRNIIGSETEGGVPPVYEGKIEVLKRGEIKRSRIRGDIVGSKAKEQGKAQED